MRTEKQIEASRLNGAKSRGPVTDAGKLNSAANSAFSTGPRTLEGKARSSRNAEKCQTLANSVALPAERSEEFIALLHNFRKSLQPVGFLEERVIETITTADWHRRRYWILGMAKVAHATALQQESSDDFTNEIHGEIGAIQTAIAVSNLADHGRSLEFFRRCDAGYSREYRHARKELKELQADRFKQEQAILDDGGDSTDFEYYVEAEPFYEKDSEPTEPEIPFRGVSANAPFSAAGTESEIQSWEPWSPDTEPAVEGAHSAPSVSAGNHTVQESIQQDVQVDAHSVVPSVAQRLAPSISPEKIAKQTEPEHSLSVDSSGIPYRSQGSGDPKLPLPSPSPLPNGF